MRLPQHGGLVRHQRRDHVHDLRKAADAHAIGLPQQRVDEPADEQRVLEVVLLLEQLRRELPLAVRERRRLRARYQTFHSSKDSHSRLGDLQQPLHVVADRADLVDLPLHVEVHRQDSARCCCRVSSGVLP